MGLRHCTVCTEITLNNLKRAKAMSLSLLAFNNRLSIREITVYYHLEESVWNMNLPSVYGRSTQIFTLMMFKVQSYAYWQVNSCQFLKPVRYLISPYLHSAIKSIINFTYLPFLPKDIFFNIITFNTLLLFFFSTKSEITFSYVDYSV